MPRKREPVTITDLGRYECAQCHVRFAWASARPIDPPDQRKGMGGRRGGGKPPKYCSAKCLNKSRGDFGYIYQRNCAKCGTQFNTKDNRAQYCSRTCGAREPRQASELPKDHWALWFGRSSAIEYRTCARCSAVYTERPNFRSFYCSRSCGDAEKKHRRSIRMRGASNIERGITWQTVAKRDGLDCYLCGEPCDPSAKGKWSPTVDHVWPVKRHGPHVWTNVRLAHRSCNSRKGSTPPTLV